MKTDLKLTLKTYWHEETVPKPKNVSKQHAITSIFRRLFTVALFWINQRLNSIYGIDIRRRILNIRERCFPHQNNLIFDSCILNSTTERRVRNFIKFLKVFYFTFKLKLITHLLNVVTIF